MYVNKCKCELAEELLISEITSRFTNIIYSERNYFRVESTYLFLTVILQVICGTYVVDSLRIPLLGGFTKQGR